MNNRFVMPVLEKALAWAETRDYAGYGKFDALNSPILHKLAGESRYSRGGLTYIISRLPINLRPLLRVRKHKHPKALALFARSYLNLYNLTNDGVWLEKGVVLLDCLLDLSLASHYAGHCWGTGHPRQSTKFYDNGDLPGAVITVEVAEAFLDAYLVTNEKSYLNVVRSAVEFITEDLVEIENAGGELCYSYIPNNSWKVINSNAKTAALLARLAALVNDRVLMSNACANIQWVMSRQTDYGAWFYADPPRDSHVKHDNYHTGFILSSLLQYMNVTGDSRWRQAYARGLEFYEQNLFLPSGAPKWRDDHVYPLDIHGAAQGILNLALASEQTPSKMESARRVFRWVTENMLDTEGRFYYQKGRFLTKRYTLMRWGQAWMCYALSILMVRLIKLEEEVSV